MQNQFYSENNRRTLDNDQNEIWSKNIIQRFDPAFRHRWEVYEDLLLTNLTKRTIWVDLGCGRNEDIAENGKKTAYAAGIDVILNPESTARPFICGDINQLPFKDNSVDFISLRFVIEHIPDPAILFRELTRILNNRGKILIITTNIQSPFIFIAKLIPYSLRRTLLQAIFNVGDNDVFKTYHKFNTYAKFKNCNLALEKILFIQDCNYLRKSLFIIFFAWHLITKPSWMKYFRTNIIALYKTEK